jgi:hypothetical protein
MIRGVRHSKSLILKIRSRDGEGLNDRVTNTIRWVDKLMKSTYRLSLLKRKLGIQSQVLLSSPGDACVIDPAQMAYLCWSILASSLSLDSIKVASRSDILPTTLPCRCFKLILERIIISIYIFVRNIKLLIFFLCA